MAGSPPDDRGVLDSGPAAHMFRLLVPGRRSTRGIGMVALTLPDGRVRRYERAPSGADVASDIGSGLAGTALAIRVNGDLWDLSRALEEDAEISIVTWRDDDELAEDVMLKILPDEYGFTRVRPDTRYSVYGFAVTDQDKFIHKFMEWEGAQ